MAPTPWYNKHDKIEELCDIIDKNNFIKFSDTEIEIICKQLGINSAVCVNGKFIHKEKLRMFYLSAKNFLFNNGIPLTGHNIGRWIQWKGINFENERTKLARKAYTHITENYYRTEKMWHKDIADNCTCSDEEKCGPQSNCINR